MTKYALISRFAFSFALLSLSLSVFYFAWVIKTVHGSIPLVAQQTKSTTNAVNLMAERIGLVSSQTSDALLEFKTFNALIPEILLESSKAREESAGAMREFSAFRQHVPAILQESERIRETLPSLLKESEHVRYTVSTAIAELQEARQSLPRMIAEVDSLIGRANHLGAKASEGAVSGVLTGLVKAPYAMIRNIAFSGKNQGRALTEEQHYSLINKIESVLQSGKVGENISLKQPNGYVELVDKSIKDDEMCHSVRIVLDTYYDQMKEICKNSEGQWYLIDPPP